MKKIIGIAFILAGMMTSAHTAEACGKVSIADMNWSSATLIANVDKFILQEGYGCEAEVIPGDTMPTGTSMVEKGKPDVAPEFWINSFGAALQKGIDEKRIRIAGESLSDGGEEGFWVPEYLVKKDPSLGTLAGIKANVKMFKHPEDPSTSAFVTCPAGWGCQITNGNLYKALELEKAGFELLDPGSAAGLAGSIAKAYESEKPWFGYYWAPTPILGKYKMVKVDFGSGIDEKHFKACLTQAECENPKPSMFPPSPVQTMTTEAFASREPEAYAYLAKRSFKNDQMNTLLAWMEENQADGDVAMEHFLKNNEATWTPWVPADVAKKVKAALAKL